MIVVTGTKRSGTSMWMQVLSAWGRPVLGEEFPSRWGETIREANPKGFYESTLRNGINATTNPDLRTGLYLSPSETRDLVVKVFPAGLRKSDIGFLDCVLVTIRPWREYVASISRLRAIEAQRHPPEVQAILERHPERHLAPALEWWLDNYTLVWDVHMRRYPAAFVSYPRVAADPQTAIPEVLAWMRLSGDVDAAVAAVVPELRNQVVPSGADDEAVSPALDAGAIAVFDELYERVHTRQGLEPAFLERMNQLQRELWPTLSVMLARARQTRAYLRRQA